MKNTLYFDKYTEYFLKKRNFTFFAIHKITIPIYYYFYMETPRAETNLSGKRILFVIEKSYKKDDTDMVSLNFGIK